jgi:hypothetical protein
MKNNLYKRLNSYIGIPEEGMRMCAFLIMLATGILIPFYPVQSLPLSPELRNHTSINTFPVEKVVLKTDRDLYLCGEKIYFSAFTIEGSQLIPVSMSTVLYVEFYDQDNRVIAKGKFTLTRGKSSGFISIPKSIVTDYYYIRAYTNYMKNFGEQQFFVSRLKIVNPFTFSGRDFSTVNDSSTLRNQKNSEMKSALDLSGDTLRERGSIAGRPESFRLKISTDKEIYKNREVAKVFIAATGNNGKPVSADLTLQVCLSGAAEIDNTTFFDSATVSRQLTKIELKYLPEIRGDMISGRLVYKDDTPAAGIEILQSFTGKSSWIESSVTDRNGNFYFQTGNEKNSGDLILKVQNAGKEISVIPDEEFYEGFMPPRKDHFQLTGDEIQLMAKYFINIQVDDAFSGGGKVETSIKDVPPAFYGKDYSEYRLSEYAKLPNMKEFIFEVIKGVVLAKENRQEVINIIDEISFRKIGANPLMLVDGVPLSESSVVIGLNPEKIALIRVIRDKYYYKNQTFDGILDIITADGDAKLLDMPPNTFRYNFIHPVKDDQPAAIDRPLNGADRIPVYKNLLLWYPGVRTDENGRAAISFTLPDNSGDFTIKGYGFSDEGLEGEGRAHIVVGENKLK